MPWLHHPQHQTCRCRVPKIFLAMIGPSTTILRIIQNLPSVNWRVQDFSDVSFKCACKWCYKPPVWVWVMIIHPNWMVLFNATPRKIEVGKILLNEWKIWSSKFFGVSITAKKYRKSGPLLSEAPASVLGPLAASRRGRTREPVDMMETTGSGLSPRKTVWIKGGLSWFLGSSTCFFELDCDYLGTTIRTHKPQWPVMLRTLDSQKVTFVSACTETRTSFCVYDLYTVYLYTYLWYMVIYMWYFKCISRMSYHACWFPTSFHTWPVSGGRLPSGRSLNHPQYFTKRGWDWNHQF